MIGKSEVALMKSTILVKGGCVVDPDTRTEGVRDVEFFGPANAEQKDMLYRKARVFVLPSPMENFSMVVLDALAYGLPVICTKGIPWKVIQDKMCGWWVDGGSVAALANAISDALVESRESLQEKGRRAVDVASGFEWNKMAGRLISEYK